MLQLPSGIRGLGDCRQRAARCCSGRIRRRRFASQVTALASCGGSDATVKGKIRPGRLRVIVLVVIFDFFDQLGRLAPFAPFPGQDVVISHQFTLSLTLCGGFRPMFYPWRPTGLAPVPARGLLSDDTRARGHPEWRAFRIIGVRKRKEFRKPIAINPFG